MPLPKTALCQQADQPGTAPWYSTLFQSMLSRKGRHTWRVGDIQRLSRCLVQVFCRFVYTYEDHADHLGASNDLRAGECAHFAHFDVSAICLWAGSLSAGISSSIPLLFTFAYTGQH